MATVKAFAIEGLKMWFWSNDHEPPHFHVKRDGEWEVKVNFMLAPTEMIEVVWGDKAIPSKVRQTLSAQAEAHRAELLAQWEAIRGH